MSTTKKRKADKTTIDIPASQSKITDSYKKPRTRSDTKKEKEEVGDSPIKEDLQKVKEECLEVTKVSSNTHELLLKAMDDMRLIKREVATISVNLEKLLALAIQEQEEGSLEEM